MTDRVEAALAKEQEIMARQNRASPAAMSDPEKAELRTWADKDNAGASTPLRFFFSREFFSREFFSREFFPPADLFLLLFPEQKTHTLSLSNFRRSWGSLFEVLHDGHGQLQGSTSHRPCEAKLCRCCDGLVICIGNSARALSHR